MFPHISLIFLLISFSYEEYIKLEKGDSMQVIPESNVYLDISSFSKNEAINFEIFMDLSNGNSSTKEKYGFYIGQVPAASYNDSNYWNNLTYVENRNVTCNNGNCTFTWKEIKQSENNYIFIVPPSPFEEFYSKYGRKIKISHKGGLSSGAIAALIIGCSCLVGAIVTIILCRRCYFKDKNYILTSAPSSSYGRPMIELGNHTSPLPYYNRGY